MPLRTDVASNGTTEELLAAIHDLKQNSTERIQTRRGRTRIDASCAVAVYPGNLSDRNGTCLKGTCRDISSTGCRMMMSGPLSVGDIYLLDLDRTKINVDPIYARCVRCQMVREDTFECGVAFFTAIELPGVSEANDLELA